jgi:serine/threonine protein kinase
MQYIKLSDLQAETLKSELRIDDEWPVERTNLCFQCEDFREFKKYKIVVPDGYAVSRHIGDGSYSSAFAATYIADGKEYVLKVPNPDRCDAWYAYSGEGPCDGVEFDVFDSEVVARAVLRGFKSETLFVPDIVLSSRIHRYIVEELAPGVPFFRMRPDDATYERTAMGIAEFITACQSLPEDRKWLLGLLHWVGADDRFARIEKLDSPALAHDDLNADNGNILWDEANGRASIVDFSIAGYADGRNSRFREFEHLNNGRLEAMARNMLVLSPAL